MAIYKSCILVLTMLALSASQDDGYQEDTSDFPVLGIAPAAAVPLYNPYECDKCWSANPGEPKILCGSDGNNYYNFEKLRCINRCKGTSVQFKYFGKCRFENFEENNGSEPGFPVQKPMLPAPAPVPVPVPYPSSGRDDCPCLKNIGKDTSAPFCGDDGYTYRSESEARCITSCYGRYITKQYDGPCNKSAKCACRLTPVSDPVCGSDRNTYMNREALDCNNYCFRQRVRVIFKGKCEEGIANRACELVCKDPEI